MPSLQDQLLKQGLADEKQAKAVKKEKKQQQKQRKQQPKGTQSVNETRERARQAREEQAARDRELNRQREEESQRRAVQAQIRELVETNRLSREGAETPYQFVHNSKIKRLYVDEQTVDALARGQLAVVCLEGTYDVVPENIARKIQERDESVVVVLHQRAEKDDDGEDPYAGFEIPDDLMW
ncbi:nucleoprotein/polynucleotide-associated enzyme [Halovibrio salipaludis]|uniref:Nucleoprotein/polynucleotide-associated enzyme n=1 Tax=Halovibrio salipaludis TaxID=2032626 RepID=A0A2A2F6I9_9GAMM|nr:DUF2058 domain-containing protein [Halovibrio salipaludis]PAU80568.1 nucleoprotein/polynucleotide-associated enzyme [Halovibrio salipaludis]